MHYGLAYKKLRYEFTNDFKVEEVNAEISKSDFKNKDILSDYALKIKLNPNIELTKGNFIVDNAMVKDLVKVNDGYILYLDYFKEFGNQKIKLEIKKFGHKFKLNQEEFNFDVKKHNKPEATLEAISDIIQLFLKM
ncbi:hypothetical protein [Metamycoplasma alkalescens]|uniref:hypothetical protein n=1 Tax=Metamycoplasma alkalescens TaxID=45363 RepID=UPI0003A187D0|nr:hypothetical protein [Metamycoplasma alkalescens]